MNKIIDKNRVYKTDEVTELLQIEKRTVLKLVKEGKLTAKKIGYGYRYSGESVLEFLNRAEEKE